MREIKSLVEKAKKYLTLSAGSLYERGDKSRLIY